MYGAAQDISPGGKPFHEISSNSKMNLVLFKLGFKRFSALLEDLTNSRLTDMKYEPLSYIAVTQT